MKNLWETARYKDAHLSKLILPNDILEGLMSWINKGKDIMLFAGNPGCGKTYFCAAYINYLKEKGKHFRFFSESDLFQRMRQNINKGFDYEYDLKEICETKYIILDDICTARNDQLSDFQKEVLHSFVDHRYTSRQPTLITSNFLLNDFKTKISEKFASRLSSKDNHLIELNWIDKRQQEYD